MTRCQPLGLAPGANIGCIEAAVSGGASCSGYKAKSQSTNESLTYYMIFRMSVDRDSFGAGDLIGESVELTSSAIVGINGRLTPRGN